MARGEQQGDNETTGPFTILSRLVTDARTLVAAEIEVQRAALACRVEIARPALLALCLALLLVQGAIACLLVMLAIGLAETLGPVWAGIAVAVAALALAALAALGALRRLRRLADIRDEQAS